jgi:hypothetical protein
MKTILTASAFILAATGAMANPNQACATGNAAFCNITGPQGPAGPAGANGTDGGFSGTIQAPAGIRPVAIGNGTPAQGVVRLDGPDGQQTYHVVNQQTVFKRDGGGTATVNAGDRISNAHEAELRNRAALIASLPPVDHPDYAERFAEIEGRLDDMENTPEPAGGVNGEDGKDGKDGRDGQDFDAAGHAAALASSTALAGLQFQSLSAGQTGWAAGVGGQFDGDAAFAVGLNHGLTDTISVNASIASTFEGNGVSAYIGASGRF